MKQKYNKQLVIECFHGPLCSQKAGLLLFSSYKFINFLDCNKFHTIPWSWCLLRTVLGAVQHSRFPAPTRQESGGRNEALYCLASLMLLALREVLSMLGASGRKPLGGSNLTQGVAAKRQNIALLSSAQARTS